MADNLTEVIFFLGFALACLFIQLIFGILLTNGVFKSRKVPKDGIVPPGVSVIVAAHDEIHNLRELVPLLINQEYPEYEVIIINDRSNDETYDYLLEASAQIPRLKMVHVAATPDHINAKKFALTLGIKAASYPWVLLTDADCRPVSSRWIQATMAQLTAQSKFVLGVSPYLKKKGFLNAFIRYEALVTAIQYIGFAANGMPYMGVGRNLAYPKAFFLETKGFNSHLRVMGGDDDLWVNENATSSTTALCVHPDARMVSIPKTTFRDYYFQKVRHLSVGKRYKFKHKIVLGLYQLTWIGFWATIFVGFFVPEFQLITGCAILFRIISHIFSSIKSVKVLGHDAEWWKLPLLDFLYPFYYISTSLVAAFTKKVRWKK